MGYPVDGSQSIAKLEIMQGRCQNIFKILITSGHATSACGLIVAHSFVLVLILMLPKHYQSTHWQMESIC